MEHARNAGELPQRWPHLAILSLTVLLALAPWFSSAAVATTLTSEWRLTGLDAAFLTIAVQMGFALGAIALSASGAADVLRANLLMFAGAVLAAVSNLAFAAVAH